MTNESIAQLRADIDTLKLKVARLECPEDDEGELTDWAKKELAEALATPRSECIPMEEIEREFLGQ